MNRRLSDHWILNAWRRTRCRHGRRQCTSATISAAQSAIFRKTHLPLEVVRKCILAAGTAPSGAHKQPWHFCLVTDPGIKGQIRQAAEQEEYRNYHGRMNAQWMSDLAAICYKPYQASPRRSTCVNCGFSPNLAIGFQRPQGQISELLCAGIRWHCMRDVDCSSARVRDRIIDPYPLSNGFFGQNLGTTFIGTGIFTFAHRIPQKRMSSP